jgi:hypothetical protein
LAFEDLQGDRPTKQWDQGITLNSWNRVYRINSHNGRATTQEKQNRPRREAKDDCRLCPASAMVFPHPKLMLTSGNDAPLKKF